MKQRKYKKEVLQKLNEQILNAETIHDFPFDLREMLYSAVLIFKESLEEDPPPQDGNVHWAQVEEDSAFVFAVNTATEENEYYVIIKITEEKVVHMKMDIDNIDWI